jgi:peptidoglycan/LPS O-acetylase OafA/YrhL
LFWAIASEVKSAGSQDRQAGMKEDSASRHRNASLTPRFTRIHWLDGVRACAAFYVVLHHIYLGVFPGFPRNPGPWYLGWLMYGQIAVVVFIVVSGFSLGLGPAQNGDRLKGGASGFFQRRAWRILPPYWAALLFSMAVAHFFLSEQPGHEVNLRTLIVHGLLVHDLVPSHSPNSAFWSIAVEAQIYLFFPLMLMLTRARSPAVTAATVLAIACAGHLLAQHVAPLSRLDHLNLQLYAGFAFGVWAIEEASSPTPWLRNWPLRWIAGAIVAGLIGLALVLGFPWVAERYFWIDIAVGFAVAIFFVGLVETRSIAARVLSVGPLDFLGQFSYSLYLVHVPIVSFLMFSPPIENPFLKYAAVAGVIAPVTVAAAYVFFLAFERPFLTIRSWAALRAWLGGASPALGSKKNAA